MGCARSFDIQRVSDHYLSAGDLYGSSQLLFENNEIRFRMSIGACYGIAQRSFTSVVEIVDNECSRGDARFEEFKHGRFVAEPEAMDTRRLR